MEFKDFKDFIETLNEAKELEQNLKLQFNIDLYKITDKYNYVIELLLDKILPNTEARDIFYYEYYEVREGEVEGETISELYSKVFEND